jgi:hypothetical protein
MDENVLEGAEKLRELMVQDGIARCQKKESPPPGFDGTCGCGDDIPPERIALGYYRCLSCQERLEKSRRKK